MLDVLKSPNPILLEKSSPVDPSDPDLKKLSDEMLDLMYKYEGVGLAAPQVGVLKRMIVIDHDYDPEDKAVPKNPIVLLNPEFVSKSDAMEESNEGCLSCPGISAPVMRHVGVKVKYTDLNGKEQTIEGTGLLSRCLQHEIDHLDGKTLFQTAKPEVRLDLLKEYQEVNA